MSNKNSIKDILSPLIASAKDCISSMERTIDEIEQTMILPQAFVKGSKNPNNLQANDRLWWLKEYGGYKHNYATDKVYYRGQFYKTVGTSRLKYDPIGYYGQGEWNDSRHTP